ncbi:MAG: cysteinyl-tRNA synthetase [Myxococcales bacterium]|nr:cysteinyl-tRNA synthetase [Myxococcales bacterium]
MNLRIHDTLSRKKIDFQPLVAGKVGIYACGPTVYDFLHVGNGRQQVAYDVMFRHLRARGFDVTYVRNITDVDDKIINRAREIGEDPATLAERFTQEFHTDVDALGCLEPTHEPRVTDSIEQIIALCEKLIANGVAYASHGDVYFSVKDLPSYGALSGQPLDQLESGARVEVDTEKKRAPLDFALWKAAKPGEPSWPSPWGAGRPGWHIECSVMAERYLGQSFDIHGGGVDLIFPHHENERAQSIGANGEGTFARVWTHNGFLNFGGGKISKSDASMKILFKRAFKIRAVIERHGGEPLRYFFMTTQYRNPLAYDLVIDGEDPATATLRFPGLEDAERRCEYAYLTMERLRDQLAVGKPAGDGAVAPEAEGWLGRLQEGLDDDFNTAEALAAWNEALQLANRILDGKLDAPKDVRRRTLERLARDFRVASDELGLAAAEPRGWLDAHRARRCALLGIDAAEVEATIVRRNEARKQKNFAEADAIRATLAAKNIEIMDTPAGTRWRVA